MLDLLYRSAGKRIWGFWNGFGNPHRATSSWNIYHPHLLHPISIQVTPGVSAVCFGDNMLIPTHR